MIPPVVQPGDEFQRVQMPNAAGIVGETPRIASVSGDLAQLEWVTFTSIPTAITVANEATDTSCSILFATAATGNLEPKTNAGLTFNSATGALSSKRGTTDGEFFGAGSGVSNTTGNYNTGFGDGTLAANTTGNYNTAIGWHTLFANTTGEYNVGIGLQALVANTTGIKNTALGMQTLNANTSGSWNVASGYQALVGNTTGSLNNAYGNDTLHSNTTGDQNTAVGDATLNFNSTGSNNTGCGQASLYNQTTGSNNTALGLSAGHDITTGSFNVVIGANANPVSLSGNAQLNLGNLVFGTGLYSGSTPSSTAVSGGRIGIGTNNPATTLDVNGNITASGTVTVGSGGVQLSGDSSAWYLGSLTSPYQVYVASNVPDLCLNLSAAELNLATGGISGKTGDFYVRADENGTATKTVQIQGYSGTAGWQTGITVPNVASGNVSVNVLKNLAVTGNITASGTLALGPTSGASPTISSNNLQANNINVNGGAGNMAIHVVGSAGTVVCGSGRLGLGDSHYVSWHGNSDGTGGGDTRLSRNAAGILQIGTTANNALGSLLLTNLTASGNVTVGNGSSTGAILKTHADGIELRNAADSTWGTMRAGRIDLSNYSGWGDAYIEKIGDASVMISAAGSITQFRQGGGLQIDSGMQFGFCSASNLNSAPDIALGRKNSSGVEINNGTVGTLRDLSARAVTASGLTLNNGASNANVLDRNGTAMIMLAADSTFITLGQDSVRVERSSDTRLRMSATSYNFGWTGLTFGYANSTTIEVNNGTTGTLRDLSLRNLTASGTATLGIYTVATLPSASSNPYAEANVSDALTPAMGSTVASGGAVKTKVRSNGTNWTVAGI